jgi:hypothetical protein
MRPKIYDETLHLKLPSVLNAGLEHVAEQQHTTKSEIVRRFIAEALRREGVQVIRSSTVEALDAA